MAQQPLLGFEKEKEEKKKENNQPALGFDDEKTGYDYFQQMEEKGYFDSEDEQEQQKVTDIEIEPLKNLKEAGSFVENLGRNLVAGTLETLVGGPIELRGEYIERFNVYPSKTLDMSEEELREKGFTDFDIREIKSLKSSGKLHEEVAGKIQNIAQNMRGEDAQAPNPVGEAKKGNYTQSGKDLAYMAASFIPSSLAAVGAGALGAPFAGLGILGIGSAGQTYDQLEEVSGISESKRWTVANVHGALEIFTESMGPVFRKVANNPAVRESFQKYTKQILRQAVSSNAPKKLAKNIGGSIAKIGFGEGTEEAINSLMTDVSDVLFGIKKYNPNQMFTNSLNSFLAGSIGGAPFGAISNRIQQKAGEAAQNELEKARQMAIDKLVENPEIFEIKKFEAFGKPRPVIDAPQLEPAEIAGILTTEPIAGELPKPRIEGPSIEMGPVVLRLPGGEAVLDTATGEKVSIEEGKEEITSTTEEKQQEEIIPQIEQMKTETGTQDNVKILQTNKDYPAQWMLVEADEIDTSHQIDFSQNPNFPEIKQPREDRGEGASIQQIQNIQAQLAPGALITDDPRVDAGPPVIDDEGDVLVGNARTIAMKRLYNEGDYKADQYKQQLKNRLEQTEGTGLYGISPEQVENFENPVLVRKISNQNIEDIEQFVQEANVPEKAQQKATEKAIKDAKKIDNEVISNLEPEESGEVNLARNRDFRTKFRQNVLTTEEQNELVSNNEFNQQGLNRIRDALFYKAYPSQELLNELAVTTDSGMKNITKAMQESAPYMVKYKNQVKKGNYVDKDISEDVIGAAKAFKAIKNSKNKKVEERRFKEAIGESDYAETTEAPEGTFNLNDTEQKILKYFYNNNNSRKKLRKFLVGYAKQGMNQHQNIKTQQFEETDKWSTDELIYRAKNIASGEAPNAGSLFEKEQKAEIPEAQIPQSELQIEGDKSAKVVNRYIKQTKQDIPLPEMVEIAQRINEGKMPVIKENLDDALGKFIFKDEEGQIQLRSDIFIGQPLAVQKVNPGEVEETKERLREEFSDVENLEIKTNKKEDKIEVRAYRRDPTIAGKVLSHEIGHLVDWIPDKKIKDSSIPGRIKQVKNFAEKNIDLNKKMKNELINLSKSWKPFSEDQDQQYLEYRTSNQELFADAISVLMNQPSLLQEKAPTFYEHFMNNLDQKPKFRAAYNDIKDRLQNRKYITEHRMEQFIADFEKAREKSKQLRQERLEEKERTSPGIKAILRRNLDDTHYRIFRHLKGAEGETQKELVDNVKKELEELSWVSSEIEDYVYQTFKNVYGPLETDYDINMTLDEFGVFLTYNRVLNDRADLGNPHGIVPNEVQADLENIQKKISEEEFNKVKELANNYYDIRQNKIIPRAEESNMFPEELLETMRNNREYVTFRVMEYMENKYGGQVASKVYEQQGTFKGIQNPFVATLLKDISILYSAKRNQSKLATVKALSNIAPESCTEAETSYNPELQKMTAKKPKSPHKEILTVLINGKPQSYYVDKNIVEVFENEPVRANAANRAFHYFQTGLKDMFVSKNPGWMSANILRDFLGTLINIPQIRIVRDFPSVVKEFAKGYKEAWQESGIRMIAKENVRSEDISEMAEGYMIQPFRMYSSVERNAKGDIDKIIDQYVKHLEPEIHEESNQAKQVLKRVYNGLDKLGRVSEIGGQVGGYKWLKKNTDLSQREIAETVRNQVGTPNFRRSGDLQRILNNLLLFSNVRKEGWKRAYHAFRQDPGGYIWKQMLTSVIPKVVEHGLKYGLPVAALNALTGSDDEKIVDKETKKVMQGVNEYYLKHYNVIPLKRNKYNQSVFLTIPQDHIGQFISILTHDILNKDFSNLPQTILRQSPWGTNIHPGVYVIQDWIQYQKGVMPRDAWQGWPVLKEETLKKGGPKAWWEMGKHSFEALGGGMFYSGAAKYKHGYIPKLLEYFPFNALGRYYRTGNWGMTEEIDKIYEKYNKFDRKADNLMEEFRKGKTENMTKSERKDFMKNLEKNKRKANVFGRITGIYADLRKQKQKIQAIDNKKELNKFLQDLNSSTRGIRHKFGLKGSLLNRSNYLTENLEKAKSKLDRRIDIFKLNIARSYMNKEPLTFQE